MLSNHLGLLYETHYFTFLSGTNGTIYALDSRRVAINPQLVKRLMLPYTVNGKAGNSNLCGFTQTQHLLSIPLNKSRALLHSY